MKYLLGSLVLACTSLAAGAAPRGLFIDDADITRLRASAQGSSGDAGVRSSYSQLSGLAQGALDDVADPFTVANMAALTYHWCSTDSDGIDNSLWDAQRHIEAQSHAVRNLALQYAVTQDAQYGNKALALMKAWAAAHTPVNMYDFNINFQNGTVDGMTTGSCSDRPWNFALDAMWQGYGLVNMSDAYLLLSRNGFSISAADNTLLRGWILKMAQAVNSSHHAWTKWADAHTNSSVFERYRVDNHLSWSNLAILAAGVALDDQAQINYVLTGGSWNDGRSGAYANPSPILYVINGAIEANGRVYEERINRDPPIGYSFFHLQPMTLIARIDEVLGRGQVWRYKGTDGAGLQEAFTHLQPYIMGTPSGSAEGNLTSHAWLYFFAQHWWPNVSGFADAKARASATQSVQQTAGPVTFLFKELGATAGEAKKPMPPVITVDP